MRGALNLNLVRDELLKENVVRPILEHFCDRLENEACLPVNLAVREQLGGGRTGNAVLSVEYGPGLLNQDSPKNTYRVMKVGPETELIKEYEGYSAFDRKGSLFFCSLEKPDKRNRCRVTPAKGKPVDYNVLIYKDASITSSAVSLKGVSHYIIDHYRHCGEEGFDPRPIGENIGDILSRLFNHLKSKVYATEVSADGHYAELLSDKLARVLKDMSVFRGVPGAEGKTPEEIITAALPQEFYAAENIHGDLNPNNILLCIDNNGKDINTAVLIDYGEVVNKKNEGFTPTFWDPSRLIGELILDFNEDLFMGSDSWEEALKWNKAIIDSIFGMGDPPILNGIWEYLFHVLFRILEAFFPSTDRAEKSDKVYTCTASLENFLAMLQCFLLFYAKFEGEEIKKRRLGVQLAFHIGGMRGSIDYERFIQNCESRKGEVISRYDTRLRYNELKKDKFAHLNIDSRILSGFSSDNVKEKKLFPIMSKTGDGTQALLFEILKIMKVGGKRHLIVTGSGGMGKTTALFHLFEELTRISGPIPVYLELQNINSATDHELSKNWILDHAVRYYTGKGMASEGEIKALADLFNRNEKSPHYVLLLDGYNEVTANHRELHKAMKGIMEFCNVMIVVTSRYNMKENSGDYKSFEVIELVGLNDSQVERYLTQPDTTSDEMSLPYPKLLKERKTLHNPMYLCLYAGTELERHTLVVDDDSLNLKGFLKPDFFDDVETPGELHHNFFESAKARWARRYSTPDDLWKHTELRFYIEEVLPELGYYLESRGLLEFNRKDVEDLVAGLVTKLEDENWRSERNYRSNGIRCMMQEYGFGRELAENILAVPGTDSLQKGQGLVMELALLRYNPINDSYSFVHQDFRDYFAAKYHHNRISDFLAAVNPGSPLEDRISAIDAHLNALRDKVLSVYVKRMLGELYREYKNNLRHKDGGFDDSHYYDHYVDSGHADYPGSKTDLDLVIDCLRGVGDIIIIKKLIFNIINVFSESKKDLSRYNFCQLNMSYVNLYGTRIGRNLKSIDSCFDSVELSKENLFHFGSDYLNGSCGVAVSNEKRCFFITYGTSIYEIDYDSEEIIYIYNIECSKIKAIDCRMNRLIGMSDCGSLFEVDIYDRTVTNRTNINLNDVSTIYYSWDGKRAIVNGFHDIVEIDLKGNTIIRSIHDAEKIFHSTRYANNDQFVTDVRVWENESGTRDNVIIWDLNNTIYYTIEGGGKCIWICDNIILYYYSKLNEILRYNFITGEKRIISLNVTDSYYASSILYADDAVLVCFVEESSMQYVDCWDLMNGERIKRISLNNGKVTSFAFAGDDSLLFGSIVGNVIKYNTLVEKIESIYNIHENEVRLILPLSDKICYSTSNDLTAKSWDMLSGKVETSFDEDVIAASACKEQELLVSISNDGYIKIRKINNSFDVFASYKDNELYSSVLWFGGSISISPDKDKLLYSYKGIIKEISITGKLLRRIEGGKDLSIPIIIGSFYYDKYIAVCSPDKTYILNSENNVIRILDQMVDPSILTGANCSSDLSKIIMGLWEKEVKLYSIIDNKLCLNNIIPSFPGLMVQGADFSRSILKMDDEHLYYLFLYGAILSEENEKKAKAFGVKWKEEQFSRYNIE